MEEAAMQEIPIPDLKTTAEDIIEMPEIQDVAITATEMLPEPIEVFIPEETIQAGTILFIEATETLIPDLIIGLRHPIDHVQT